MRTLSITRALLAAAAGSPAAAQVVRAGTPVTGRPPMRVVPLVPAPRPDVPLLIGLYSGHAIRIDNRASAAVRKSFASSCRAGISQPMGVATDMYDRLYVALPRADRVLRMDDITGAGLKLFDPGRVPGFTRPTHAGPASIVPLRPGRRDDVPR